MTKQYFAIANRVAAQYGVRLDRKECISEYTEGKETSLSALDNFEKQAFYKHLNAIYPPPSDQQLIENTPDNKMRRKIFSFFHKMGYAGKDGKVSIDTVDNWCIKYAKEHKKLQAHSYNELTYLVSQVEKVYQTFIRDIEQ